MAVGAHAHFIAAVTDGDGLCPEGAGFGQEQGRVGDHVVDGLAAHVVVVTVQSLSRPLQADKMGGTEEADAVSYEVPGCVLRDHGKGRLGSPVGEGFLQEMVGGPVCDHQDLGSGLGKGKGQVGGAGGAVGLSDTAAVLHADGKAR